MRSFARAPDSPEQKYPHKLSGRGGRRLQGHQTQLHGGYYIILDEIVGAGHAFIGVIVAGRVNNCAFKLMLYLKREQTNFCAEIRRPRRYARAQHNAVTRITAPYDKHEIN